MEFINSVAIVTGFAQKIGVAIVEQIPKEEASVYGFDRTQPQAREGKFRAISVDLTNHNGFRSAVQETAGESSSLDILVNTAGVSYGKKLFSSSLEHWPHMQGVKSRNVCRE